jgi:hypothetical protein
VEPVRIGSRGLRPAFLLAAVLVGCSQLKFLKPPSVPRPLGQLLAVAAGMHAPVTWKLESLPAKVLVFGLP